MANSDRPPLYRPTWRMVIAFLALDVALTFALVLLIARLASGAPPQLASPRAVLDAQVIAWNRGDLESFMDGYWRSDELTFYSTDQVIKGWQATLERYRKRYQGEGQEMGRLEFNDLVINEIGGDAAFVRGRYKLTLKDGKTPSGLFTLVMRKIDGRWKIIHDHTSTGSEK